MAGAYELVHLALLTSCSPIHSGEGDTKRTSKDPTHLDTHLNRAITFTDTVCFMFKPHDHCGEKCILRCILKILLSSNTFWGVY